MKKSNLVTFQEATCCDPLALHPAPAVDGLADVWAAMAHNKLHKLRINIMKTINDGIADRQTFAFDLAQMLQVF